MDREELWGAVERQTQTGKIGLRRLMMIGNYFDFHKSLQVLYYLQSRANMSDKLSLLKMIFFADRYHIRHYGVSMLMDKYVAMNLGPVCSKTYDLMKKGLYYDGLTDEDKQFVTQNLSCIKDTVEVNDTGFDDLSISDVEALDFAIANFAKFSPSELSQITHAYPEWSRYQYVLEHHFSAAEDMDYRDFFDNPESNNECIQKFFDGKDPYADDPDVLLAMKSEYGETL